MVNSFNLHYVLSPYLGDLNFFCIFYLSHWLYPTKILTTLVSRIQKDIYHRLFSSFSLISKLHSVSRTRDILSVYNTKSTWWLSLEVIAETVRGIVPLVLVPIFDKLICILENFNKLQRLSPSFISQYPALIVQIEIYGQAL